MVDVWHFICVIFTTDIPTFSPGNPYFGKRSAICPG